ncbi:sodium-dependent multivitamin transporter-like [Ruditapes philippinarum]|uniref:sodium-dependent multivitamin transporter-like n=1 Tax=Ruditapes philippinarum TaxID=129788 RepID=UPI00295B0D32|nr:sodium-dependent multivitamin transporter-like [Ruditapes philippinarum]
MSSERNYSFETGQKNTFSVVDYVIFGATLGISTFIGFFYAIKDRKISDTKLFLLAGGKMNFVPVSMSLLASFMSAITLLGTPAEMYNYGTMYWWIGLSYAGSVAMAAHIYVPIFYNLKITSCYEYLEKRFSRGVRLMGTCIFSLQMIIYMSIVLYGPSLALNAVTGLSLWGAVVSVGSLCTIYTAVGGMKAVLWTDTFQTTMMIIGLLATLIQGCIEMGGFTNAWQIAKDNQRVYFDDFSFDPGVRHSFWALTIGSAFLWGSVYGTNQAQVQRSLSCGTLRDAQIALWINFPGLCVILMLACLVGVVMYAFYSTCDPIKFGLIMASDQLYPLFVMDLLSHVPGVPGLFVACIFSGTLSTISSGLNSLSAVTLTDLIRPLSPNMSESRATNISKLIALLYGILCLGLTYVASKLGNILQAALSLFGMLGAPMLGLFTLGMIFPWANSKGAFAGTFASLIMMMWIGIGAYITKPVSWRPPISLEGCNWNLSRTLSSINSSLAISNTSDLTSVNSGFNQSNIIKGITKSPPEGIDRLYTLSYLWYSATALAIVVIVGMVVSVITGRQDPKKIDARLICPLFDVIFPFLSEKIRKPLRFGVKHEGKYNQEPRHTQTPLMEIKDGEIQLPSVEMELEYHAKHDELKEKKTLFNCFKD